MEKISIFEYQDYKKFINDWLERTPHNGRGQRKILADAMGCQGPFVTHVLNGDYHLSLEQAEACCRWMRLPEKETEFFLLLVLRQRSGTKALESVLTRQISERRIVQTTLKKRLNIREQMTLEDQVTYYSQWYYAAIHMACMIPELQTVEALQKYFRLSLPQINSALEFLTEKKMIEEVRSRYKVLKPVLHLEKTSGLLAQHHTGWRLKGIEALFRRNDSDLFYSGVVSLSEEDFEWLRERISQVLDDMMVRLKDSQDEKLACLNFDWFVV